MPTATAPALSFNVTVTWAASTGPGGGPVDGYVVRRYPAAGGAAVIPTGGCGGTVAGTSCVETGAPAGAWKYAVAPVLGAWRGGESGLSATVIVPGV